MQYLDYDLNDSASVNSTTSSSYPYNSNNSSGHLMSGGLLNNRSTTSLSRRRRNHHHLQLHDDHSSDRITTTAGVAPGVEARVEVGAGMRREIQPQYQNWLARFLRIKPAVSMLCFQTSRIRARKEITAILREWRKFGFRDVVVDKAAGRIWGRVAMRNCGFLFFFSMNFSCGKNPLPLSFFSSFPFLPLLLPSLSRLIHNPSALNIKPVSLAIELFTILHHSRKANLSIARFTQEKGAKSSFERVVQALEKVLANRGFLVEEKTKALDMMAVLGGL